MDLLLDLANNLPDKELKKPIMENLLHIQYTSTRESRQVVFQFLQEQAKDHLNTPLKPFNSKTIAYLYLYIANTYIAWAGNFALGDATAYYDQDATVSHFQLQNIFENVDELMFRFSGFGNPRGKARSVKSI